jgi:hypothetical protein
MSNEKRGSVCGQCGIAFTNQQDMEEYVKLEPKKGQQPTGVT